MIPFPLFFTILSSHLTNNNNFIWLNVCWSHIVHKFTISAKTLFESNPLVKVFKMLKETIFVLTLETNLSSFPLIPQMKTREKKERYICIMSAFNTKFCEIFYSFCLKQEFSLYKSVWGGRGLYISQWMSLLQCTLIFKVPSTPKIYHPYYFVAPVKMKVWNWYSEKILFSFEKYF